MNADTSAIPGAAVHPTTWDVLRILGFEPDASVISEGRSGLSIGLGRWRLTAGLMSNRQLKPVVVFGGQVMTARAVCRIEFEMPTLIESKEQCAAWIAWNLMRQLPRDDRVFTPEQASFVLLGLQHQATLPWVQEQVAYDARPTCMVERSWLRQAFRQLAVDMVDAPPESLCVIAFDGSVLTFNTIGGLVPLPAKGKKWPQRYSVAIANFSRFPAKLRDELVLISVWKNQLHIGNRVFDGLAVADEASDDVPAVQGKLDFERS